VKSEEGGGNYELRMQNAELKPHPGPPLGEGGKLRMQN
jgi:hypothetical protein